METKLETFSKQKFCINSNVFHTHTSTCQVLTVENMFFIVLQLRLSLDYHVFLQEQCLDSLQRFITLNNCKDVSLNVHLKTEKSNFRISMHSNFSSNVLVYVSQQKKCNFMSPPETL